jgi:pyrophosphatase PpaX
LEKDCGAKFKEIMEGITTILFDIDGTVLDTREFIIRATEHALSSLGYRVPERSIIESTVGMPFPDYYHILAGPDADADKLIEAHRNFQYSNFNLARLFPKTIEVLNYLKNKNYKLGAVTTRSKTTINQNLIDTKIFDLFDTVVSFEDTKKLKPNPEPLLKALGKLNETPEKAVMIGDSHLDIEAGKNAGTKTIRAAYGFHSDNLHNPEPNFIIDDIGDLLKIL